MKIKIDKYVVYRKKRSYEILVFLDCEYMYVYDARPREDCYEVQGNKDAIRNIMTATAILAEDPSKIIYFPCKKKNIYGKLNFEFNLVMLRPELQFRRSEWYRLKARLDKKHWAGKYVLNYNQQKLLDQDRKMKSSWLYPKWEKRGWKTYVQEELGDTVFWVCAREMYYDLHSGLAENMKKFEDEDFEFSWNYIGSSIGDKYLSEFLERRKADQRRFEEGYEVNDRWGRLKSGAGWIWLGNPTYCTVGKTIQNNNKTGNTGTKTSNTKTVDEIAKEVIQGKWGNGEDRKQKLMAAGYDYSVIQKRVNEILA